VLRPRLVECPNDRPGAELNPVDDGRLYPRRFMVGDLTDADERLLHDLAQHERRLDDQAIGVGFGERAEAEAATDARKRHDDSVGASDS